jgi:ECF transporter S component (folate family)
MQKSQKNCLGSKQFRATNVITTAAMMTAISVLIGIFCKNYMNFGVPPGLFRVTFENLPIIMSGILYGPIIGGVVGVLTDLTSYLLSSQAYPPNLIVTLGAAVSGIVAGLVAKFIIKKKGRAQIIVAGSFSHFIASMIIKSIGLYQFYGWLVLVRIPLYLCIAPIEILIICALLKRKSFARIVGYVEENTHELQ